MKGIIKDPTVIKYNSKAMQKSKYSLIQRIRYFRERTVKLHLFKLFLRQYEIQRKLKKHFPKDPTVKKQQRNADKKDELLNVRIKEMMTRTLNSRGVY